MREPDQIRGVAEAEPVRLDKRPRRRAQLCLRFDPFSIGSPPCGLAAAESRSRGSGQPNMLDQVDFVSVIDPNAQRLADPGPGLRQGAPIGVAALH